MSGVFVVEGIDLPLATIFLLDFGTVPIVSFFFVFWVFLFFFFHFITFIA